MGFVQPEPPPFDLEEWKRQPFLTRLSFTRQHTFIIAIASFAVVHPPLALAADETVGLVSIPAEAVSIARNLTTSQL